MSSEDENMSECERRRMENIKENKRMLHSLEMKKVKKNYNN